MAESSNDLEKARKSIQTAREKAEDYKKRIDAAQTAFDAAILDAQSKNENKSSDERQLCSQLLRTIQLAFSVLTLVYSAEIVFADLLCIARQHCY